MSDFQRFNLRTMSGIFPGTRTKIFQRLRLKEVGDGLAEDALTDDTFRWAILLWDEEDARCTLYLQALVAEGGGATWCREPLIELRPSLEDLNRQLQDALNGLGWQLYSCGSCAFWQPAPLGEVDPLPMGHCRRVQRSSPPTGSLTALTMQSSLALHCQVWQHHTVPQAVLASQDETGLEEMVVDEKPSLFGRFKRRFLGHQPTNKRPTWSETLVERSGVGAGTESCFACQGRLANLGALTAETEMGDTQTFSVWRCRMCYTYTLSNWIDRWERLDTLETEEFIYRITPFEAFSLLEKMAHTVGGEHPNRRHQRNEQRDEFYQLLQDRPILSHQVKHGR